jgi:hypothetical protein
MNEDCPQSNNQVGPHRAGSACAYTKAEPVVGYQPIDTHNALSGRDLRYVLTNYIQQGHCTVRGLARQLAADGYTVWGRVSKVISDALRWEVRNGRVVRLKRGVYRIGRIPRTTQHRIGTRVRALFFASHVVATRRNANANRTHKSNRSADRHWQEWMKSRPAMAAHTA